jgi:pimeloyl-ACP methyl ester carboxylesterase
MTTFCLVHGANLGAWCWEPLMSELTARGHQTIAMDLPIDELNAGLSDFADVVMQSLKGIKDDIILVGHSFAGMVIPIVATQHPVQQLIFLGGLIPQIGMSGLDQFYDEVEPSRLEKINYQPPSAKLFEQLSDEPDIYMPPCPALIEQSSINEALVMKLCFHDCEPDVARWAMSKLREHISLVSLTEIFPLQTMPDVEYTYIVSTDDRIISPTWSKYAARKRLGVEAIELPGGHYPHISHPVQLAEVLTKTI